MIVSLGGICYLSIYRILDSDLICMVLIYIPRGYCVVCLGWDFGFGYGDYCTL